uniref:BY PROTMAP: gi/342321509/gb/EGU13442.1/ Proteophosphoglycan ppg4 [Rhodotorula glutinis ATCC 204091] n=1 Tax=Rhodotorula toruloides TaxID=5286 RepID=A0A0K3CFY1_RHOTO
MTPEPLHSSSSLVLGVSASANAHSQPPDRSFAHLHDKRTLGIHLPGLDFGIGGGSRRPSASWRCNGSGKDGYSDDWLGLGRPFWIPQGWLYFGTSIGWAPSAGWECSASSNIPSLFLNIVHDVTRWKPPSAWLDAHVGVDLGFTAPSWWGRSSGKDGWSIDSQGNGRPSWAPAGWLWFGSSIGWAPPASWSCSSSWQIPTQWSSVWRVTWWRPDTAWLIYHREHDFGWSVPSFWGLPSCGCSCGCGAKTSPAPWSIVVSTTSRAPSTTSRPAQTTTSRPATSSTQKAATTHKSSSSAACTTSSTKAAATTTRKASTTTHKASSSTHKASTTKKVSTTSKKPSTKTSVQATTTHKPSTKTITVTGPGQVVTVTETHNLPSPPAPTNRPGQGWECSGSGNDGWDVDWQGNGCPSHLPSGWKWWGVSIGWGPSKGWNCGSNWTPSPVEVDSCSKTKWWTPPPSLRLPSGVECPAGWTSIGWIDHRRPSPSWTCDGTGRDGYEFDHYGNGRPSYLPVGWKWFGQRHGWQPCSSFQLPSSLAAPGPSEATSAALDGGTAATFAARSAVIVVLTILYYSLRIQAGVRRRPRTLLRRSTALDGEDAFVSLRSWLVRLGKLLIVRPALQRRRTYTLRFPPPHHLGPTLVVSLFLLAHTLS